MVQPTPQVFPPRPLGQIFPIGKHRPVPIGWRPPPHPPFVGGAVQVDGIQADVIAAETWESPFGPYVQVDGVQATILVAETNGGVFSQAVQIDGVQCVILVLET